MDTSGWLAEGLKKVEAAPLSRVVRLRSITIHGMLESTALIPAR
jgi:hypothetical protein